MMHPAPQPDAVKITGEAETLGAVAALLGFHPTDSLVLMCLTGDRRRVGPVIRVDLEAGQIPAGIAAQLAAHAAQHAEEVLVITFTDPEAAISPDTADLVAALRKVCDVLDVIDASNTPHQVPADLMAAGVLHGRAVLPDRAALARSVEHTPTTHPADPVIVAAMGTVTGRDQWLMAHGTDPAAVPALVTATQATRDGDPRIPNMCAALAVIAYRRGDGALAQVAVNRTLRSDPDHRLAHLMLAVMAAGMPPTHPRRLPGGPRHLQVAKLYTRADAITDGLLIEVPPKLVDLYRLPWPLAITATAWADAIDWPPAAHHARPGTDRHHESIEGRLADVLFKVKTSHEAARPDTDAHPSRCGGPRPPRRPTTPGRCA